MKRIFSTPLFASFVFFCLFLLAVVAALNLKTQRDSHRLLETSVRSQLISICVAARSLLDSDEILKLNSLADTENNPDYDRNLQRLRSMADAVGAKYIYVLRKFGERCVFVYDTDTEDTTVFTEYEPSPVHVAAFKGHDVADISNVKDKYGNFSTGAIPLWHNGAVAAIVSADIEDTLVAENTRLGRINTALLIGAVAATMAAMAAVLTHLLRRIRAMQEKLSRLAHYDTVTGLPNRQYLIEFLAKTVRTDKKMPFAILFIDLDNFKKVNDVAGHDAGDALLKRIGAYLKNPFDRRGHTKVFRLAAGRLNVAARVGGDEFIMVAPDIANEAAAGDFAHELLARFRTEMIDENIHAFNVGMSIGVSLYPSQSEDYNVLIKYADIAMYHAKRGGKNGYRVYGAELPDKPGK